MAGKTIYIRRKRGLSNARCMIRTKGKGQRTHDVSGWSGAAGSARDVFTNRFCKIQIYPAIPEHPRAVNNNNDRRPSHNILLICFKLSWYPHRSERSKSKPPIPIRLERRNMPSDAKEPVKEQSAETPKSFYPLSLTLLQI